MAAHKKPEPKHRLVRGDDLPSDASEFYRAMDWLFDDQESNYVAVAAGVADAYAIGEAPDRLEPTVPECPRCDLPMRCILNQQRPSWKEVFERRIYEDPAIYSPMHYIYHRGPPA